MLHLQGDMLPHLCFLLLVVPFDSEGAVIDGSDDTGVHSTSPTTIARSPHLEWLLQRNKEKETGGDKMRISFFVDLLDEPLIENGGKESRKSFLDALLSEPLFDNGLAKAVMETQKKSPEIIDIPMSPSLGSMESNDQWPEIFYPPSTNQIFRGDDNQPRDFSLNTLEFVKHNGDKMERLSGNSIKSTSNGQKHLAPLKNANLIESVFDIIESIPSIDDLSTKMPRSEHGSSLMTRNDALEVNGKGDSDNSKQSVTINKPVPLRNRKTTSKEISRNHEIQNKRHSLSIFTQAPSTIHQRAKPLLPNKKKILHHLIYLFPKKMKNKSSDHFERKKSNSVIHSRRRSKVVNKHMHTREKNGDNFRNLFIPLQQYIKPQSFKHFRYGSLFPYYSYYNLHSRNPDLQYISLNSFDDVSVFPQREVYLMPHTLVNHKTPVSLFYEVLCLIYLIYCLLKNYYYKASDKEYSQITFVIIN